VPGKVGDGRDQERIGVIADHASGLPPAWPQGQKNSPMGSNDFRSTKRNILWTALRHPVGPGVLVLSDGRQNARATVETDRISLYINSWYGSTNAGLWEWEHNYGKGKLLKKGDHILETVRLRFARSLCHWGKSAPPCLMLLFAGLD